MNPPSSFLLCATDFSAPARDAATVAATLARRRGEKLRLVHATDATRPGLLAGLQSRLDTEAARLRPLAGEVEPGLLEARRPVEKFLAELRADPPTLVVVGGSVKLAVDRWMLGSFSERIADRAPIPTLVVRNPAAFESWDWAKSRLTLLLALDFSASSDVVLRWAAQFQHAGPCELIACHVNWKVPATDEAALPGGLANSATQQRQLERDLRKKVRDQIGDSSVEVVVRPHFGDPGPCLGALARERKAHLVAVGTHQRRGIHRLAQFSVSRELLHDTALNVVCVPVATKFDAREAHIPEFRRVLVATDFSELGDTAVPFACAACGLGGLVKIVHVASRRAAARGAGTRWSAELRARLRGLIPHEAAARGQPPEVQVIAADDVPRAICDEAERFGADLVCLASHGLGASRALHGSVTKAVLKRLRRPLLVVRRPEA